jgi:(2Fe-2S) ferredoxin
MSEERGSKYVRHFFVCQMQRPPGAKPSCGSRGAAAVYNTLMEALGAHMDLWDSVCVTASGCLGPCHDGPIAVCYPEGVWYSGLNSENVAEIAERHLVGGEPVDRLRYHFPPLD